MHACQVPCERGTPIPRPHRERQIVGRPLARELPPTRAAHDARTKTSHAPAPAPCVLRSLKDNKGGSMTTSTTRFEVGRILATPGALAVMRAAGESALGFLKRS